MEVCCVPWSCPHRVVFTYLLSCMKSSHSTCDVSDTLGVGDEIPTYEEVVQLEPDPNVCRPILLVGAPGVGRKTLIHKLVASNPSLYQPVVQRKSVICACKSTFAEILIPCGLNKCPMGSFTVGLWPPVIKNLFSLLNIIWVFPHISTF